MLDIHRNLQEDLKPHPLSIIGIDLVRECALAFISLTDLVLSWSYCSELPYVFHWSFRSQRCSVYFHSF